jgi:hypothetical protein
MPGQGGEICTADNPTATKVLYVGNIHTYYQSIFSVQSSSHGVSLNLCPHRIVFPCIGELRRWSPFYTSPFVPGGKLLQNKQLAMHVRELESSPRRSSFPLYYTPYIAHLTKTPTEAPPFSPHHHKFAVCSRLPDPSPLFSSH